MGVEWLESPFTVPNTLTWEPGWRQVCGLVWDIWGIALALESTMTVGADWSVVHLPSGWSMGSFPSRHQAMAFAEGVAALGDWDGAGLPYGHRPSQETYGAALALRQRCGGR